MLQHIMVDYTKSQIWNTLVYFCVFLHFTKNNSDLIGRAKDGTKKTFILTVFGQYEMDFLLKKYDGITVQSNKLFFQLWCRKMQKIRNGHGYEYTGTELINNGMEMLKNNTKLAKLMQNFNVIDVWIVK